MKISECLWKEQFVDKLDRKHHVATDEVEEVFQNDPRYDYIARGHVKGENVYRALGHTDGGRYLAVFFLYKQRGKALPVSARDMTAKERRRYEAK